jgi:hypothetical protein
MRSKILLFSLIAAASLLTACTRQPASPTVGLAGRVLRVEIADTPILQTQGLSNHAPLTDEEGMLFIFGQKSRRTFWMKEMLFPLDIIWIDGNTIVKIDKKLPPEGPSPSKLYDSGVPVDFVLEVNGGWSDSAGLKEGDKLKISL